jgi:hemerythrin superfamily protein
MDAIGVLVAQHRAIVGLFREVERETRRRRLASAVSRLAEELIAHMAAEETVFYPELRRMLDDGPEMDVRVREEHLHLRIELRRMLEADFAGASFGERIAGMRVLFDRHADHEEQVLFPRFAQAASDSQRQALGSEIIASRPPVWIVTTEGRTLVRTKGEWALRSRVSLPIPAKS